MQIRFIATRGFVIIGLLVFAGCNSKPAVDQGPATTDVSTHGHTHGDGHSHTDGHAHRGYWCTEHGIPEEICALCNPKVAAELKAKGDWCAQHGVPDSQCFTCHPELEAKFAADYKAKFGEDPPKQPVN